MIEESVVLRSLVFFQVIVLKKALKYYRIM